MGINSPEEMKKLLKKDLLDLTTTISDDIKKELTKRTELSVYSNEPSVYKRTYGFLSSIDDDVNYNFTKGSYRISVFFNPSKMKKGKGIFKNNKKAYAYGKHRDAYGNDVREDLIGWLEDGHAASRPYAVSADSYGQPADEAHVVGLHSYPGYEGGHMLRDTGEWLYTQIPHHILNTFAGKDGKNLYVEK